MLSEQNINTLENDPAQRQSLQELHKQDIRKLEGRVKEILRYQDLQMLGYGNRSTIWSLVKKNKFPPPHEIGNRPGWFRESLEQWKATRPIINYNNEIVA